jgi:hypothetical protein
MSANVTPDLLGRFVTTMLPFGDLASLDGHELGVANLTSVMRVYRSTVFGNTLAPASSVKVGVRGGLYPGAPANAKGPDRIGSGSEVGIYVGRKAKWRAGE